ncbi:MAG: 1-deoxy-D-xylulose-5-phosphate reductoisomerase [Clostridiales bacterium]|nr:1-deoxy-D-xylulose-5-phosphate reductoisomerase [Clostridiales bacterium]
MKNISLLGSTGSIGTQTLEVVRAYPEELCVKALTCGSRIGLLKEQIKEFKPELVVVFDQDKALELEKEIKSPEFSSYEEKIPEVMSGMEGLIAAATLSSADIVLTAVVGMIGIRPTIAAIEAGKDIALANKETLVTAGHIIMPLAKAHGVKILPVDSEHSAIFQSLNGEDRKALDKILLTASGGPFRGRRREELSNITPEDALKHPNWSMGAKITIDSSTLVNKGLEVMEAQWLFGVPAEQIQVVVQPQSIIHSMVQFDDGGIIAQLGTPDMKLPIMYALFYPERKFLEGERLDFWKLSEITFEKPDTDNFPGLRLAYEAAGEGGSMPTVYNAVNEEAVSLFLRRKIGYLDIADTIACCMSSHKTVNNPDLDQILMIENELRGEVARRFE